LEKNPELRKIKKRIKERKVIGWNTYGLSPAGTPVQRCGASGVLKYDRIWRPHLEGEAADFYFYLFRFDFDYG
jgi:hypothetical protein